MIESQGIVESIRKIAEPVITEEQLELIDIEFKRSKSGWVLRLIIDKEGGVNLEDCSRVNMQIGQLLDIEDIIPYSYNLEVSSPGIERPLKSKNDFIRFKGEKAKIRTSEPISGQRNFIGEILDLVSDNLIIKDERDVNIKIPLSNIIKANIAYDFKKIKFK